jgi:hypothetical protein
MNVVRVAWRLVLVAALASSTLAGCQIAAPSADNHVPATTAAPTSAAATIEPTTGAPASPASLACVGSGDQNAINARLRQSGSAALCPGAMFDLTGPVIVDADGQQIYTEGRPTGGTRATLRLASASLTTAVLMRDFDGAVLSNVIVDGNRDVLGPRSGDALVYAGGYADGQIIRGNRVMNTRSWSSVHLIQGHSESQACTNGLVEDNEIGPAGTSDDMQWADGISLACSHSRVRRNVITDATDGAIVVFGAVGSVIEDNTIRAETRTLLGGINMVDEGPYAGSYVGTVVHRNVIDASGAVIRIGLGMGPRVWGCLAAAAAGDTITGGTVTGNTLRGPKMQYGYAVDGVSDWTVTGNVDEAGHAGRPSTDCNGRVASRPAGFLYTPAHAKGVFQPAFAPGRLDLALWAIVAPRPGQ